MSKNSLESRAAALCAAWRNAQDLALISWEAMTDRERGIWQSVAAAEARQAVPEGEQWTVTLTQRSAKAKGQIVLTAPNAELVLSGDATSVDNRQQLVDAGLRGFRIE